MLKVRLVDSICYNDWHHRFNSCLVNVISDVAQQIEYRGIQRFSTTKSNLNCRRILVVKNHGKIGIILRYLLSCLNDIWQLLIASRNEIIIYSIDSPFSLFCVNEINKLLNKKVVFIQHGSLEMLNEKANGSGMFYWLERKFVRFVFLSNRCTIGKNLYLLVLGDVILKNLKSLLPPEKYNRFRSIDLLSEFDSSQKAKNLDSSTEILIGTLGVLNEFKGAKELVFLARELKRKRDLNIVLSVTGKIDFNLSLLKEVGIDLPSNDGVGMLTFSELESRINNLDYILFLYNSETYRLTASGALFEAINRRRPIIAFKNDFFTYIFEKYGPFGYLVDSFDEMIDLIVRLSDGAVKTREVFDFDRIQNALSIGKLSGNFENIMFEIGYI